jgi:hypothetical protein
MSHRLAIIALLVLVVALLTSGAVLAQEAGTKQVAVVVAFPEGEPYLQVVTVPADATTFDVLQQAADLEVISQLGEFGQALCKINATGCAADNCFCDAEHFWAYYHLNAGAWEQSAGSVDTFNPANGAVEGFAWSGFDADYNPTVKPPVYTFEQLQNPISAAGSSLGRVIAILMLVGLVIFGIVVVVLLIRGRRK